MKYFALLVSLMASLAIADSTPEKCATRVKEAGCLLSNNDFGRVSENVNKCRQVKSASGASTFEIFLLKNSDKVVVIKTHGQGVPAGHHKSCPVTKYTVDASGVEDFKIIGNKVWMYSHDGQLYVMLADESFWEILSHSGRSYDQVDDVKGVSGRADVAEIHMKHANPFFLTSEEVGKFTQPYSGRARQVKFWRTSTERSLFRDE